MTLVGAKIVVTMTHQNVPNLCRMLTSTQIGYIKVGAKIGGTMTLQNVPNLCRMLTTSILHKLGT